MQNYLIPFGLLIFIVLFVYALIHTSRNQQKAKSRSFKDFAAKNGLRYQDEDDGNAQRFALDFDGVGRFRSASTGKVIPKDVVSGTLNGLQVILFRHSIRYEQGWAREWFVAGLTHPEPIANRCAVQFCERKSQQSTMYLPDGIVKERQVGSFLMVVRADALSNAGKLTYDRVLMQLAELAESLSFRPEIQVREKRIIAYLADRNATVDDVDTLGALFEFTHKAACL